MVCVYFCIFFTGQSYVPKAGEETAGRRVLPPSNREEGVTASEGVSTCNASTATTGGSWQERGTMASRRTQGTQGERGSTVYMFGRM